MSDPIEEPLNRGLVTVRDARFLRPGELSRADGARYKAGDIAVWPAEGRVLVGDGTHATTPITDLGSRRWPAGTILNTADEPELRQLFYQSQNESAAPFGGIKTLPASANPRGSNMDGGASLFWGSYIGSPWRLIEFDRDLHIWGPLGRRVIRRPVVVAGPQPQIAFTPWHAIVVPDDLAGLESPTEAQLLHKTSGLYFQRQAGIGGFEPNHYYWIWAVPYDSINDIEYATDLWPQLTLSSYTEQAVGPFTIPTLGYKFAAGNPTPFSIDIFMEEEAFQLHFSGVDSVRIYMADPQLDAFLNPYPIGYRIRTIEIATLPPPTNLFFPSALPMRKLLDNFSVFPPLNLDAFHSNPPYPTVTISIAGEDIVVPRNFTVDKGSAAEVFNEAVIVADKAKSRFSVQGDAYAFPRQYEINHGIDVYDEIVGYAALNRALAVFMSKRVERVNTLPTNEDFNFGQARVRDVIIPDEGCVSPRAFCKFTLGVRSMVAWVSQRGLRIGDIHDVIELASRNLDWDALVGENLSTAILVNNPEEWRLEFYYSKTESIADRVLYFHYHPDNVDENGLPAPMGPTRLPGGVAAAELIELEDGRQIVVTSDAHGKLFYNGGAFTDESTGDPIAFRIGTRAIFPVGKGRHGQVVGAMVDLKHADGDGDAVLSVIGVPGTVIANKPISAEDIDAGYALKSVNDGVEHVVIVVAAPSPPKAAINSVGVFIDPSFREPARRSP